MAIQRCYAAFLNLIYDKYVSAIDHKAREAYVFSIYAAIFVFFILVFSGEFTGEILNSNSQRQTAIGAMLLLSALLSMTGRVEPVKQNRLITIPFYLGAMGLIITGIMHPIGDGYLHFGFMLITVYPCFYLVWNNRRDYGTLFGWLSKSSIMVNLLYITYSAALFLAERERFAEDRFRGTTLNANYFSSVGMLLFCSAAYMIYCSRKEKKKAIFYSVSAAIGMAVTLLGQSRGSAVILAAVIVIVAIFWFKTRPQKKASRRTRLIIAAAAVIFILAVGLYSAGIASGKIQLEHNSSVIERFSPEGKSVDTFTSGRISLWEIYIPMLNMSGNDVDAINWEELPVTKAAHCHNNFIELGYRCGIPVSTVFILLELFAGIISIIYLFDRRRRAECFLYPAIIMIMYAVNSMIDVATLPMERYAPFFFYIVLAMIIDREGTARETTGSER